MKNMKLRAYFWQCHTDDETGIVIIAGSVKEAKVLGTAEWGRTVGHEPDWFINQCCKWQRNANITGLSKGFVNELEGLRRGLYGWVEDGACDVCSNDRHLTSINGKAMCSTCEEKVE